jgi:hypothetical protein
MPADDPALDRPPPGRARRRGALPWWVTLLVFAALAAGGFAAWHYANRPGNGVRVDDLRADLVAQLPPGSTGDQIEGWFRDHGITGYSETLDINRQKVGYHAVVPNDTLMDRADIMIECRTDKAGRLVESSVDRVPRLEGP